MYRGVILFIFLSFGFIANAQWNNSGNPFNQQSTRKSNTQVGGFLRFVNYHQYSKWNEDRFSDYAIHNQLYVYTQFDKYNSFFGSIQNRVIFGEAYEANNSGYANSLLSNNDLVNLSFIVAEEDRYLVHSEIDLLYYQWKSKVARVRIGRQRYFWNQSLIWNPNNFLNTYSVLGYDVVNRAGLESISARFSLDKKNKWKWEMVYAPHKTFDQSIVTSRLHYKNKHNEFQLVGGSILEDYSFGFGFTTFVRETGFSGEVTYFKAKDNEVGYDAFLVDLSSFYQFPSKIIFMGEVLYHSNPQQTVQPTSIFTNQSVKHLISNELQVAGIVQYPVYKSTTIGASAIYYVDDEFTSFNAFINSDITKSLNFYVSYNLFGNQDAVLEGDSRKYLLGQLALRF